jgi:hypothetical protein
LVSEIIDAIEGRNTISSLVYLSGTYVDVLAGCPNKILASPIVRDPDPKNESLCEKSSFFCFQQ